MGKRKRLNQLISKWIKSDLPEDKSSVLLLRVTRAAPSPKPSRRPFSLPHALGVVSSCSKFQVRRTPSSVSGGNGRRASVCRRDSRRDSIANKGERPQQQALPPPQQDGHEDSDSQVIQLTLGGEQFQNGKTSSTNEHQTANPPSISSNPPIPLEHHNPLPPSPVDLKTIRKRISDRRSAFLNIDLPTITLSSPKNQHITLWPGDNNVSTLRSSSSVCPSFRVRTNNNGRSAVEMDTSMVDSIGTCSLDMETSQELPQACSEVSSTATLRGSLVPQPNQNLHLPSYLSLACTINGYSTTTNYDPVRLARSRDASPHRIDTTGNHLTMDQSSNYSVTNHLLSPPNLVPLPTTPKMTEKNAPLRTHHHHHQEFYSSSKTVTFLGKESHQYSTSSSVYKSDTTDGCIQRKKSNKCTVESTTTISKEYTNGQETKSFIQQRVERLYGPGALAQGFFTTKRQKDRLSESDTYKTHHAETYRLNKTLPDKLSDEENIEPWTMMKPSASGNQALPVLRHLRPEFRAQLPLKKVVDAAQTQKSVTVPKLNDEVVVNGHGKGAKEDSGVEQVGVVKQNGSAVHLVEDEEEESGAKDGHYFIKILEEQAARILSLAERAEAEIDTPDLSEEVVCKLRSAVGKGKLLVSQKIQQFKGLCTKNITQIPGEKFPTTNEDLQGFWDMVMLQVREVDKVFDEIDALRENNWIEAAPKKEVKSNGTTAKQRKPASKPKMSAAAEEARKQREEQRKKMIEEKRKAMRAAQQSKPIDRIEIFAPESS